MKKMSDPNDTTHIGFPTNLGFKSMKELRDLTMLVTLNSIEEVQAFEHWKKDDGTKDGLLHLLGVEPNEDLRRYVFRNVTCRDRYFEYRKQLAQEEFGEKMAAIQGEYLEAMRAIELLRIHALLAMPDSHPED